MVKILHTADLHIDSPFSMFDLEKAKQRKTELRRTFNNLVEYCVRENINIVLIAGDLFDMEFVTSDTINYIADCMRKASDVKFVITPGNHDFYCQNGAYDTDVFSSNVYIFKKTQVQKISFDDLETDIYGYAFTSDYLETNMISKIRCENKQRLSIVIGHADIFTKNSKYCPVTVDDIENTGCNYVALGHIHKGSKVDNVGDTYFSYSGCLEGRSFDECGKTHVVVGEFDKYLNQFGENRWNGKFRFETFSTRYYEKADCDITGCFNRREIAEKIYSLINEKGYNDRTLLRVTLKGLVRPDFTFDLNSITGDDVGVYYLELKNDVIPTLDNSDLLEDISIRGVFYKELLPKLQSQDEKEREIARIALEYGMKALGGYSPSDL